MVPGQSCKVLRAFKDRRLKITIIIIIIITSHRALKHETMDTKCFLEFNDRSLGVCWITIYVHVPALPYLVTPLPPHISSCLQYSFSLWQQTTHSPKALPLMPTSKETDVHFALYFVDDFGRPITKTFELCVNQIMRGILQVQPTSSVTHYVHTSTSSTLSWGLTH